MKIVHTFLTLVALGLFSACSAVNAEVISAKATIENKTIDERIENPPSQEMVEQMRLRAGYHQAQQQLFEAVANYYYAKGWREAYESCLKGKYPTQKTQKTKSQ